MTNWNKKKQTGETSCMDHTQNSFMPHIASELEILESVKRKTVKQLFLLDARCNVMKGPSYMYRRMSFSFSY